MEKFRFLKSLKAQIGIVLAVQLVLFSAIISITLYELNLRKHDYIILNLAGQLRVISQSMANQSHIYLEQDKFTKASAPYNSAVFKNPTTTNRHGPDTGLV